MEILSREELEGIKMRNSIINMDNIRLELLKAEAKTYQRAILKNHGLNEDGEYSIDERGEIKEIEQKD